MGCAWYSVYYCEGEGYIMKYKGTVTGFIGMCNKNGIHDLSNVYIIGYKSLQKEEGVTLFFGSLKSNMSISIPGPYEITDDFYECEKMSGMKKYIQIPEEISENTYIQTSGILRLMTTCLESVESYEYDDGPTDDEIEKYGKEIFDNMK
jgi:hypothetical protein